MIAFSTRDSNVVTATAAMVGALAMVMEGVAAMQQQQQCNGDSNGGFCDSG